MYVHGVSFSLFESVLEYIIQRERQLFDVQNYGLDRGLC